jgi:hypothetical protein
LLCNLCNVTDVLIIVNYYAAFLSVLKQLSCALFNLCLWMSVKSSIVERDSGCKENRGFALCLDGQGVASSHKTVHDSFASYDFLLKAIKKTSRLERQTVASLMVCLVSLSLI